MMNKKYSFQEIGVEGAYFLQETVSLPPESIPILDKEKRLVSPNGMVRAAFTDEKEFDSGSYGVLSLANRITPEKQELILFKKPRLSMMNLTQEAIVQYLAYKCLEAEGIPWAIPRVRDLFLKDTETWFSMDAILGINPEEFFRSSKSTEKDFFFLLAQISLLLWSLESHLSLDHRDIKADNLLLKLEPCVLQIQIHGKVWKLLSPFQVVILDFGFACIGSNGLRSRPLINLGDGVLPPMDPCPKEGRDMFQLLTSFFSIKSLSEKLSPRAITKIDGWLSVGKKSYGSMARRWSSENWVYLVASQSDFSMPSCCPARILPELLSELTGFLFVE